MESASRRIQQTGFDNEDLKTWYKYNEMKVHIVLQDENMQLFNTAVDNLNKAKALYNEFVQYRNNRFNPSKPATEINSLFNSANSLINVAYRKLDGIGKKSENYQYDTVGLKENLDALKEKIRLQEEYWNQYIASIETAKQKTQ